MDIYESVNKFLIDKNTVDAKKKLTESVVKPITVKVTYDNGDISTTKINTDLAGAKKYFIGQKFVYFEDEETGKEYSRKAVKVEELTESKNDIELEESMDTEVHTFDKPMDL